MYTTTVTTRQSEEEKKKDDNRTVEEDVEPVPLGERTPARLRIIWRNVIGIIVLHFLAVYGFVNGYRDAKLWTWIWNIGYGVVAGFGITAGAHRLWAHKSYSAKTPLRIFLAYLYCMAGQTHFYKWIRDHRTHHRYTETCADPHDATRGFFFSHIGWLMVKRDPAVKEYGSKIDMSDIAADPVIKFFDKYYEVIMLTLCFAMPILVPILVWDETWFISVHAALIRYVWSLHATFVVNSFAHMWGNRPYNRRVKPTENPAVSFFALGEGWHNYHHSFPWDYKAAELGAYGLNPTTGFIELMALVGLAYDLKTPRKELVDRTIARKGDGTSSLWGRRRC
ncbi:acyl-CoA Delta-9 desaturase-like [Apis cerana]|uniref:acyl-CoA Delta-9 desaturase-like n=1 Tax=Apis cerana TaxID=7461 RepID=UPI0007E2AE1E|nr:acyl-CoA Delta-9 desaturase-like [Apis cerana]XP_028521410.1 acyl-CoA Delta-9 desaturase-like [Apis cerana]XP_061939158.1 acyl-CoA Delta-9 desaturase-like [Apis cerana]XP_061939159.1 acyl-CoA Delta-9 desaturase-like [Apis cerana]XP_061939160.1 acyl-CoA Delta-9 desaturase-like [Apis cerana]XP_061939161.1 acyl-CoA Delta-9 desaturase-like [Apis cerana]